MELPARILAFAGSTRSGSYNKFLVKIAACAAAEAGAQVTYLDLRELPLPIFDEDEEKRHGIPENARKLKEHLRAHRGFLIASPEYTGSVPAVLKNAIDWSTRLESEDEVPLGCFIGKVAALMSAAPGQLGGLRGLTHLREILTNIGVTVLPNQVTIANAHTAFDTEGLLRDGRLSKYVWSLGHSFAQYVACVGSYYDRRQAAAEATFPPQSLGAPRDAERRE